MKRILYPLLVLAALSTSACATRATAPEALGWASATQVVRVIVPDWQATQGRLQRFEKRRGQWHAVGAPIDIVVGRTGTAWGSGLDRIARAPGDPVKREGDGKAPAGVFRIGPAFGYADHLETGLAYLPMTEQHFCMDVPASPLYNQIVDAQRVGDTAVKGSTEPMRLDRVTPGDMRYQRGFVIEHNAQAVPGQGSCIFAHQWKNRDTPTAGCTAMAPENMAELAAWLDRRARPVFVLMPATNYLQQQAALGLPPLETTAE